MNVPFLSLKEVTDLHNKEINGNRVNHIYYSWDGKGTEICLDIHMTRVSANMES